MPYQQSARVYDAIYSFKDYASEATQVRRFGEQHAQRPCETLLDVATGTGAHLVHLKDHFTVEGLDISPEMLRIARERMPDTRLHQASMTDFDLGKRFDVVTCLFSSIGYLLTEDALATAIRTFAKHLNPGGMVLVEPWLYPDDYKTGTIHANFVDEPDLKISRMVRSKREGDVSVMAMHHMVLTDEEGVTTYVETHRLRLFTHNTYMTAFTDAGLRVTHDAQGLTGRGLYIGVSG